MRFGASSLHPSKPTIFDRMIYCSTKYVNISHHTLRDWLHMSKYVNVHDGIVREVLLLRPLSCVQQCATARATCDDFPISSIVNVIHHPSGVAMAACVLSLDCGFGWVQ